MGCCSRVLLSIIGLLFVNQLCFAEMCAQLTKVSGGEYHTLALAEDNSLWACGSNNDYQLGLTDEVSYSLTLQPVLGEGGIGVLENIVAFDAGWFHSLAADADGVLYAWGQNTHGQRHRYLV
jgi:alpha-tubulin suppressor-like RCC1 family protein